MPLWRVAAVGLALVGYAVASHLLMVHWPDRAWSVAVLFGPLLGGLALTGLIRRQAWIVAAAVLMALGLAVVVWRGGVGVEPLYVLQHAAMHVVGAWTFGSTLRPGATPLITLLAQHVHSHLDEAQRLYTRWLTGLWAVYFIAMIGISLLVYALAPWPWWSLYGNLLTPLAAGALFVGEHLIRPWRHPEFERVTLAGAMRAYRAVTASK
jgi:uncharacterized membrane protein